MNAIIESLDRAIQSGEYPPNTRLPSERDLARRFDVPVSVARDIRHDVRPVDCMMIQRASTSRFASALDSPALPEALTHPASNPNRSGRNAVPA